MLWRPRKSSIIIPSELHEKLARTSQRIDEVPSEVVSVRILRAGSDYDPEDSSLYPSRHITPKKVATERETDEADTSRSYWPYP